ncbi:MAG: hypothetical protein ACAH95_07195 [Fimbriimonas sp.]
MKRELALALIAAACVTRAQSQNIQEARIVAALSKLRAEPQLYLEVNGSETINGVAKLYRTQIWWESQAPNGRLTTRFNLRMIHQNAPGGPLLVQRIVANGDTVWNYDHMRREYSALQYGGYGSQGRPQNYNRDVLNFINSASKGQAAWAAKLLREIENDGGVAYRSWMPGVAPYELPDGPSPDPVWNERVYLGTPSVDHIMYNNAPRRTVVFQLEDDPPSDVYRLSNVFLNERSKVGTADRLLEWVLKPYKVFAFDESNFTPYNYEETRGWKPIVSSGAIKQ